MKTWILSIAAALGASAAFADFVLAERGKPAECAIVAEGDAPSLRYAATELRDFTKRMTGVELAINPAQVPARRIVLSIAGEDDAFRLRVEGDALTVVGGVRGVLYGVYELLETYGGCGWYAPWCDEIPELARFAVPDGLDFADRPAIQMREPLWRHTRVPDFAARLRMSGNSFSLGPRHGGVSHRFSRRLQNCHTFAKLVPTEKYFDAHPEYFSEVKGVRVRTEPQLCLSNPDVLRIVIDEVRKTIAAEPEAKYFGVSQNDWDHFCTCPKCAAIDEEEGSHAGTIVRFVNAVAEAIEKDHPDKIIETLAYNWGRKAPKKTKVRHNVMICLCTTECDYSRPISEPGWKGNAECLEAFREWGAICSNIYVWNYNLNTYHNVSPFPNFRSMQGNFRLFRDSNASSVYEEGDHLGWHSEFAELKAYLTAKWTWNPDIPAERLLTKFFNGYYGAAAPYVRQYFDELNALPIDPTVEPLDYQRTDMSHFVPDEFLRRAAGLWKQALEAVKGDAVREYNVRMGRLSVDYEYLVRDLRVIRMDSKGLSPKRIALAKRVQDALDEAAAAKRPVCLSHGEARAADFAARIRTMAEGKAVGDGRKAFVEETVLDMSRYGSYMKFADDPAASGGQALKLFDNYHNWYVTFHPDKVAFDPGVKYRARIRARFDKRPGATDDLPVLDCGIYNPTAKTFTPKRVWTVKDFPADGSYALMGDLDWVPAAGDVMWIMPGDFDRSKDDARNPALTGLYIDGIELTRVDDPR